MDRDGVDFFFLSSSLVSMSANSSMELSDRTGVSERLAHRVVSCRVVSCLVFCVYCRWAQLIWAKMAETM